MNLNNGKKTVAGTLAVVILLDQFPRNIWRNKPQSFAQDYIALSIVLDGLHPTGWIRKLKHPLAASFALIPLSHCENETVQKLNVEMVTELGQVVGDKDPSIDLVNQFVKFGGVHCNVLTKFHRFPNRNKILARESTPEELEYLSKGIFH